jgi:hypothetical protein
VRAYAKHLLPYRLASAFFASIKSIAGASIMRRLPENVAKEFAAAYQNATSGNGDEELLSVDDC